MQKEKLITNEKPLKIKGEFKEVLKSIIKTKKTPSPKKPEHKAQ